MEQVDMVDAMPTFLSAGPKVKIKCQEQETEQFELLKTILKVRRRSENIYSLLCRFCSLSHDQITTSRSMSHGNNRHRTPKMTWP